MSDSASCYCGAVALTFEGDIEQAIDCNCSLCRRGGGLLWFGPRSAVAFQTDPAALRTCTFNAHRLQHRFCGICGLAPFSEGTGPEGAEMVAVNLRCVPALDLATLKIVPYGGAVI